MHVFIESFGIAKGNGRAQAVVAFSTSHIRNAFNLSKCFITKQTDTCVALIITQV